MDRVAILGGTFDPVHWGHLLIAETALSQLSLDRVVWVPNRHPPHKRALPYEHRRLMVKKAIANYPAFILSEIEVANSQSDYALLTLLNLQNAYPSCQWYWIVGIDAFQTLPRWYGRECLIPACDWLVAPRLLTGEGRGGEGERGRGGGFLSSTSTRVKSILSSASVNFQEGSLDREIEGLVDSLCQQVAAQLAAQDIQIRWQRLQMPLLAISSSLIRESCRQYRSIRDLVPDEIRAYIHTHNLYSDQANP